MFYGNMMLALSPTYRPRRGRIKEGEALAVYFAMNISSVLGDIHRNGHFASVMRDTARSGHHRVEDEKHSISSR